MYELNNVGINLVNLSALNANRLPSEQPTNIVRFLFKAYNTVKKLTSKGYIDILHTFKHGLEILSNLLKLVAEERPILILGMPGLALTAIGFAVAIYTVYVFNQIRYFSIPATLIAVASRLRECN